MRHPATSTLAIALLALIAVPAIGEGQWSQFRGPSAGAVADDPRLPDTWSESENVIWKTNIQGSGSRASPRAL
jgi:hypothetical protein